MRPFVVYSLPRSRSAWLSVFLSRKGPVGHDLGIECGTPENFLAALQGPLTGTCETGAAFAWPAIRAALPSARFLVVRRDPRDVAASLERFGIDGQLPELERRAADMAAHADPADTLTVEFERLRDPETCDAAHRWCLGEPMETAWWRQLDPLNIQVDLVRRIERLQAGRARIDALKAQVRQLLATRS